MHPLRYAFGLFLLATFGFIPNTDADPAPDSNAPVAVVKALYRSSLDHFGFDAASVKSSKPWVAPDLYARMLEKVNQPTPKGDAPDIEGDLFFDAQDLPTSFAVSQTCTIDRGEASVDVLIKWSDEKRHYIVVLRQIGGAWKVTDVNYGKDGTLRDLIK
jgi:hypothetical protein